MAELLLQYFTKAKGEFIMTENKTLKIVVIITGILTVLLGFYTLVRPLMTFFSIGWIFGIFLLINGIELVILSLSKEKKISLPVFLVFWKHLPVSFYYLAASKDSLQM